MSVAFHLERLRGLCVAGAGFRFFDGAAFCFFDGVVFFLTVLLFFFAGAFISGDDELGDFEPTIGIGSPPPRPYRAR